MRRLIRLLVGAWIVMCAGSWIAAALMARTGHGQGFIAGWGQGNNWLVSLMVYADGRVYARKFHDNATTHHGPFITSAHGLVQPFVGFIATTPHSTTIKVPFRSILVVSLAAGFYVFIQPWLRRRTRLHRNRCPACAYPIGQSPVCTECGHDLGKRQLAMGNGSGAET